MAIVLPEEKKAFNWKAVITIVVVIGALGVGVYFLFFAATPAIEVIIPQAVRSTAELFGIQLDPSSVINSPKFRSLRRYAAEPTTGKTGRENPFIKF